MHCKCGYSFSHHVLSEPPAYRSFLVVADSQYPSFLDREIRARQCAGGGEHLARLAESAELAGSMLLCPECGRLVLVYPDGSGPAYYRSEP